MPANKLTLVVPIYNVEKFLPECLDSLLAQTRKDFSVFLIDDGSKDNSGKIAQEYSKNHPNVFTYVYQDNKGLGGARNTGFNLVTTKFVIFIDSDDFVGPKYIENIYRYLDKYGEFDIGLTMPATYDMLTDNYWDYMDAFIVEDIFKDKEFTNIKISPELFSVEANVPRAVWNVNFLKENNFAFEEQIRWEDIEPHFTLMNKARRVVFLNFGGGYYYRINSGGGQITSQTGKTRLEMIYVFKKALESGMKSDWSDMQYVHFLRVMNSYFLWTLDVIDNLYRKDFIIGMSCIYRKIPKKYYFVYRKLKFPYDHLNRRFVIALFARSKLFRRILFTRRRFHYFNRIWDITTGFFK